LRTSEVEGGEPLFATRVTESLLIPIAWVSA
jgi:hypothetical protein